MDTSENVPDCDFNVGATSKTPYVAIDERGLVRNIHLFLFFLCALVK